MSGNKYVLAMYDVRGKQEYIFRNNGKDAGNERTIKEIVGASCVIRDVFLDYLATAAIRVDADGHVHDGQASNGIYSYLWKKDDNGEFISKRDEVYKREVCKSDRDVSFERSKYIEHLEEGYIGEVVYEGGGNFLVLYRSEEICKAINRIFTKTLLEKTYTLKVLCSYTPVDEGLLDYEGDRDRLYDVHAKLEAGESVVRPAFGLTLTKVDANTSLPLSMRSPLPEDKGALVSIDSYCKLSKYCRISETESKDYGNNVLSDIITQRGEDSWLAVVYIDGNNMGAKVQLALKQAKSRSYDDCVTVMRQFSCDIQKNLVEDRKDAIDACLDHKRRFVVFAGDEMSFICNADIAMKAVKQYFKTLPKEYSSCAGIALFHIRAPYMEAYNIAEECCENAKSYMKKLNETDTCYVDFHYCQGGMGMSLEDIRANEVSGICSKPWRLDDRGTPDAANQCTKMSKVDAVVAALTDEKMSRTNVKGLAVAAYESSAALAKEMKRINAHHKDLKTDTVNFLESEVNEKTRSLVYDIVQVYDHWYRQSGEGQRDE